MAASKIIKVAREDEEYLDRIGSKILKNRSPLSVFLLFLKDRIQQVRLAISRRKKGIIQFEFQSGGRLHYWHVQMDGPKTRILEGRSPDRCDASIFMNDGSIASFFGEKISQASEVFGVHGDRELAASFIEALLGAPASQTPLNLRISR